MLQGVERTCWLSCGGWSSPSPTRSPRRLTPSPSYHRRLDRRISSRTAVDLRRGGSRTARRLGTPTAVRTGSATETSARPSRQAGRPAVCCAPRLGSSTSVLGDGGARAIGVRRDAVRLTVKCRRLAALGARDGMWLLSVLSLGPDFFMG